MSRAAEILEPQLESEIASHRSRPLARWYPPAQAARSAPAARAAAAPPSVADFERIEDYLQAYLEDEHFHSTHPLARGRWIVAWEMLWCADTRAKVIAVAQHAAEAIVAFGFSLLEARPPPAMQPPGPELRAELARRTDPLELVTALTREHGQQIGEQRSELLVALFEHWRALAARVRAHEQGAPAAVGRLRWEDGRRLVLFTALVMVEVDRSFA